VRKGTVSYTDDVLKNRLSPARQCTLWSATKSSCDPTTTERWKLSFSSSLRNAWYPHSPHSLNTSNHDGKDVSQICARLIKLTACTARDRLLGIILFTTVTQHWKQNLHLQFYGLYVQ